MRFYVGVVHVHCFLLMGLWDGVLMKMCSIGYAQLGKWIWQGANFAANIYGKMVKVMGFDSKSVNSNSLCRFAALERMPTIETNLRAGGSSLKFCSERYKAAEKMRHGSAFRLHSVVTFSAFPCRPRQESRPQKREKEQNNWFTVGPGRGESRVPSTRSAPNWRSSSSSCTAKGCREGGWG